jgi:hypothetical protein
VIVPDVVMKASAPSATIDESVPPVTTTEIPLDAVALPPTTGTYVSGLWATTQPYDVKNPKYNTWGNFPTWPPNNSPNP